MQGEGAGIGVPEKHIFRVRVEGLGSWDEAVDGIGTVLGDERGFVSDRGEENRESRREGEQGVRSIKYLHLAMEKFVLMMVLIKQFVKSKSQQKVRSMSES